MLKLSKSKSLQIMMVAMHAVCAQHSNSNSFSPRGNSNDHGSELQPKLQSGDHSNTSSSSKHLAGQSSCFTVSWQGLLDTLMAATRAWTVTAIAVAAAAAAADI